MQNQSQIESTSPELWGGIECTINRVGDRFFDQLNYSKHYTRESDIDLIAELGIRKLRYPVLWEKHQPQLNTDIDWRWITTRLNKLKEKGIDPIAGLVHHGSGPLFTNLVDDQFPYLLASYASKVAEQFPWLQYYTPVNEPLTTARFSGLYGLWYPHQTTNKSFAKALLNQLKGVVLSMQAIRKINPYAKLVQTEDLGKTYSTKKLAYQARFENERRWLTYDFLTGNFDSNHYLFKFFKKQGISEKDLLFFKENPCTPDYFGFNYYVTSERYIDERLENFPRRVHGGNGRHRYADVEVVRVDIEQETGIEELLSEAWERFRKPLAITEVHLHCSREEQLRWFKYVRDGCLNMQKKGVEIKAITAWALLGSYGWNRLLTKPKGVYEPGVFDLRSKEPRPTALAKFIKQLSSSQECHPISNEKGWWKRSIRIMYPSPLVTMDVMHHYSGNSAPIMIIGKTGTLGNAFAKVCSERSIPYVLVGRKDCDIGDPAFIENCIQTYKPWAVVNTAGYVRVDDAEAEVEKCFRENAVGAYNLAVICQRLGIKLLTFSSDLVFNGNQQKPYVESDVVDPLNVYGRSKAKCEQDVLATNPSALVIRTSAFFGPWDEYNFVHYVMENLSKQQQIIVANDQLISPTYIPDLVHTSLDLLIDDESGIWHLANKGSISWSDLAFETANASRLNTMFINAVSTPELNQVALRPKYSVLGTEKGILLPKLDNALSRFFKEKKTRLKTKSIV